MKKVLILTYDFPPFFSVGALRPFFWYHYFSEYNVFPIVVTRQWSNKHNNKFDYVASGFSKETEREVNSRGIIIKTPYQPNLSNRLLLKYGPQRLNLIRKLITAYYEFFQFLFPIGPKRNIYKGAREYLKSEDADIIIASGDPFVLLHYAEKLSAEFNIPWIADFRDPWSQDISLRSKPIFRTWSKYNEKRLLNKANSVTTVSEFIANQLMVNDPARVNIIPNGYDPESISAAKDVSQNQKVLTIAYAGTIYNWHPVRLFLEALSKWVHNNPAQPVKVDFYGINVQHEIEHYLNSTYKSLKDYVVFHERLSHDKLIRKLATANVFLLFNDYSFSGTKIYDYLGLNRMILLCFANDKEAQQLKEQYYQIDEKASPNKNMQASIIKRTNSGIVVEDSAQLYCILETLNKEFKENGQINARSKGIENYSRKEQTRKMAEIINKLSK